MQVGQRVRLKAPMEVTWVGDIQPGVTGTVIPYRRFGAMDSILGLVRLDEPHPFLLALGDDCDGLEMPVYDPEHCDARGWDDWEVI